MTRRLWYEARIAVRPGTWLLPGLFAVLRVSGVIRTEGWRPMLESVYPILFPLLAVGLLEQERHRRTAEVLVAAPGSKAAVLAVRFIFVSIPLVGVAAAAARPVDWLLVLPAGFLLAGIVLLSGMAFGSEIGLAIALGWWGVSFAVGLGARHVLENPIGNWFLLVLGPASLAPAALAARKTTHLVVGLLLIAGCACLYGRRYWRGFSR